MKNLLKKIEIKDLKGGNMTYEEIINLPLTPENNREFEYTGDYRTTYTCNPWREYIKNRLRELKRHKEFKEIDPFDINAEGISKLFTDPAKFYLNHKFSKDLHLPPLEPIISISGLPVFTRGNISIVTGKTKSAKSSFIVYSILRQFIDPNHDNSGIGINLRPNPEGVVYLDTEQSIGDFYSRINSCLNICGKDSIPEWIYAYNLREFNPDMLLLLTQSILFDAFLQSNGLQLLIIDGIADYSKEGLNDEKESNKIAKFIDQLAQIYNIHIMLILHKNKTSDTTRGHLGSQFDRKLEAIFDIQKQENGQILVVPEKFRKVGLCPTLRYEFDESGVLHYLRSELPKGYKEKVDLLQRIFSSREVISKKEIIGQIMAFSKVKERRARDILKDLVDTGKIAENEQEDEYKLPDPMISAPTIRRFDGNSIPATG